MCSFNVNSIYMKAVTAPRSCLRSKIGFELAHQESLGLEVILDLAHGILSAVELDHVNQCQPVPLYGSKVGYP
jgi:hypothetical protein